MRIHRKERRIKTLGTLGKYCAMAGLLLLVASLIVSWAKPEWFIVLLTSLPIGTLLTVIGGFLSDRYAGPLAHHQVLSNALKGLDDRYVLLDYVLPASHVLLEPSGLTAFVIKTQSGKINYQERGRWKHYQKGKFFRQIAGQEGVGSPDLEAERAVRKLEQWLERNLPGTNVPVRGAIIFANPDITLNVGDAQVPAFHAKQVKSWLRGAGARERLALDVHLKLVKALPLPVQERR